MNIKIKYSLLTERVLEFQKTGKGLNALISDLLMKIYNYPKKKGFKDDYCSDFIIYFIPKFKKCAVKFKDLGKPFEYYLDSLLYWHLKIFIRKKMALKYAWKTSSSKDFWEISESSNTLESILNNILHCSENSNIFSIDKNGKILKESERKQLLFLILKNALTINFDDIEIVAKMTGFPSQWIIVLVDELKRTLTDKLDRLSYLIDRRNRTFWKIKFIEKQVYNKINKREVDKLKGRLQRLKKTLIITTRTISSIPLWPSHKEISRVSGMPKGTVDSSLRSLKKKLLQVSKDKGMKYA